jgi:folate-binding protein YgfZ
MASCDPLTRDLLSRGPWVRTHAPYAVLRVQGRDAQDFLQRLCSQDVVALGKGECRPAAFLDGKGKLVGTCWIARVGDDYLLETQAHQAPTLLELLDRFHFTEKLGFAAEAWQCTQWIGAGHAPGIDLPDGHARDLHGGGVVLALTRRGLHWVHAHAPAHGARDPVFGALEGRPLDETTAELLRMGAGLVRVGVDTEPGTLALEADLDDHVSLTKGCFTGQEIVARIHTYGHVNRRLVLLHLQGEGALEAPVQLVEPEDGVAVGRVMRAVAAPGKGVRVGLGYLPKDFWTVGTKLRLGEVGGPWVEVVGFGQG